MLRNCQPVISIAPFLEMCRGRRSASLLRYHVTTGNTRAQYVVMTLCWKHLTAKFFVSNVRLTNCIHLGHQACPAITCLVVVSGFGSFLVRCWVDLRSIWGRLGGLFGPFVCVCSRVKLLDTTTQATQTTYATYATSLNNSHNCHLSSHEHRHSSIVPISIYFSQCTTHAHHTTHSVRPTIETLRLHGDAHTGTKASKRSADRKEHVTDSRNAMNKTNLHLWEHHPCSAFVR